MISLRSLLTVCCLALAISGCACTGGKTVSGYTIPTGGDAARGAALINQYRCGACHLIPGIHDARGLVAPPLISFAERTFIAGEVPNTADNLVHWIKSPQEIEPGTAMPTLGLDDQQARDVAAYLYTLR